MAPRPETLTCCLSQAGIASAPLKANEVERVKSELRQRAKASSRAADSVSVDEVLHVLRPLVELLKQTAPDFTSAQVSSRQSFWRNAAEVTLGRAEGAAIFKRSLKDPGVIAAVDEGLCLELAPAAGEGAKRRKVAEATPAPEAASSTHKGIMQRHATQMDALRRQCDQDEKMLLEKHQKAFEMRRLSYIEMMDTALGNLKLDQEKQMRWLKDHSRARTEALRSKQLGDFFSPVLHVTLGRGNVHVCQGFYELSPIHTRGWQPVYRKYKSRYFLYLSKQCWWISTESNMLMRQPRGLLHSGAVRLNDSPARPERATNWKVVGSGKKWESIDLKLDDLKEPKAEFVVVSMAGTELLRKSFQLHETVVTVKTTLSRTLKASWNRPADFIRLCLGSQALSNAKELGRLTIGAGTPLQAVLIPINCKHCMVSLEKQWYPCCRCSNCHQYLCLECGARCRECDYCMANICNECAMDCDHLCCRCCAEESEYSEEDDGEFYY